MTLEQLIYEMLTESTGTALCDSGGAYGRHWERNQKRSLQDFESDPSVEVDLESYTVEDILGGCYTISVFHYLTTAPLEIDEDCEEFNRINTKADNWDGDTYGVSSEGQEWLDEHGFELGNTFNSYNGESMLSQTIQGTYVTTPSGKYILLQIHQGCDVRGGYTDARLLKFTDGYEWLPSENVYGSLTLKNGETEAVDNRYNGVCLTNENGGEFVADEVESIELELPDNY